MTSTLAAPYSGIVRITMTYDCSECTGNYKGTGFFVSDNCILTAGHVIKCKHNKYCTTLRLRVRKKGGSTYNIDNMYTLDVLDYYISPNFTSHSQTAYDYAYIKTPANIGSNSYHFKLEEMSTSLLSNQPITVAGFSGNAFYVCDSTTCGYDLSKGLIRYYADTEGGQSGSPVYYCNSSGDYVAIAIHTLGIPEGSTQEYNQGWRITTSFINQLKSAGLYSD